MVSRGIGHLDSSPLTAAVGLASWRHSKELPPTPPHEPDEVDEQPITYPETRRSRPTEGHGSTAHDHEPFTETEISLALDKGKSQAPMPIAA